MDILLSMYLNVICLFFQGLFRDVFGTYDQAFYFGGIGILFGGLVLMGGNIYKFIRDRKAKEVTSEGHV